MDTYTIFESGSTAVAVASPPEESGVDTAQLELEAALQLLAERAQFLSGASGASVALLEDGTLICRAGAGRAPQVGTEVGTAPGPVGESLRTRELVRSDECRELGAKAAMVMPLLGGDGAVGVFELVADRPVAFEDHDIATLRRLSEMR